jgi:phosphate transport system protein
MDEESDMFGGTIRFKELMEKTVERLESFANLTEEMIKQSIDALVNDKIEIYQELKEKMVDIKDFRVSLEKSVVNSIALHQPFASDLRFLISSLKIANEIERTARDAIHIAHSSKYFDRSMKNLTKCVEEIGELAKKALYMYTESIQFFLARKAVDIGRWTILDDEVDDMHKRLIEDLTEQITANGESTRAVISLILTTRYIERVADHSCNICEEAIFVATSKREPID